MNTKASVLILCVALLIVTSIIATAFPAAAVQVFTIVSCATTTACTGGNNTSGGPGVQGTSSLGKGVVGQAKFNSTSSTNGQSGVLGQDLSTSGAFDTGVKGTSVRGTGVSGTSSSNAGVSGSSSSNIGVRGTSSTNSAVQGSSTSGVGVRAISSSNTAVFGSTTTGSFALEGSAPSTIGVLGIGRTGLEGADNNTGGDVIFANGNGSNLIRANNSGGTDVFTVFNSGETRMQDANIGDTGSANTALLVNSGTGAGIIANSIDDIAVDANAPGVSAVAVDATAGGVLYRGTNASSSLEVFEVDSAGNVHAHSFSSDLATVTRTSNGSAISTYSNEVRTPTIEDFGEATLAGGQVYVRLDPGFAAALARGAPYLVFITPQGFTRGTLYVTQKTPSGFYVRENVADRSAVVFDYRIVGKRYMAPARPIRSTIRAPKLLRVPALPRHPKIRIIP